MSPYDKIDLDADLVGHFAEFAQVLLRQNGRRGHHSRLKSIVLGQKHGHEGDHCLATAHISLHEAIHLYWASQIATNFFEDALLCARELEGHVLLKKSEEVLADSLEGRSLSLRTAHFAASGEH